jgi:molybdopterin converting factor small subunit
MEESISGFKVRGDWGDVVEHGERITLALRETGADGDAFHDFDDWRPKSHERIDEDVSAKTAEQASVNEGEGEQAGKTPGDDLQTAGEKLTESYEKVEENDTESAVESWGESIEHVARAADSAGRKALRKVEDTVYQKVMTQMAPYYFDNELVSANVQEVGRGENGETFVFEVNINEDERKATVSDILAEYETEIDRWHVETEKRTDDIAAAEGLEPPEKEGGPDSTMT